MRSARKFVALSAGERRLLAKAVVAVGSIRIGLWILPFRILRPLLARFAGAAVAPDARAAAPDADRLAWAVSTAARRVPRATCLTQALAAQLLLARSGERSELHIGVARDERRGVTAHAWLAARGRIVLGGESVERYLPLSSLAEREV
jgi:hypothetical protein